MPVRLPAPALPPAEYPRRRRAGTSQPPRRLRVWAHLDGKRVSTEPLRFADRLHRFLTGLRIESIDEHDSIEMVGLMLYAPRQQIAALQRDRLSVHVHALGHHSLGALAFEGEVGNR